MTRRNTLPYALLVLLFAATVVYQARFLQDIYGAVVHPQTIPENPLWLQDGNNVVKLVGDSAKAAGIKVGDVVLEVDGKPLTGDSVYGDVLARAKPGDIIPLKVLPKGQAQPELVRVTLQSRARSLRRGMVSVVLFGGMPLIAIVLGFWTAAVRPRDRLAWFLLLLLLGFTQLLDVHIERWGPVLRDFGELYHGMLNDTWPIWMLLFGLYFPEPFPPGSWRKAAEVFKWILVSLLTLTTVLDASASALAIESYRWSAPLWNILTAWSSFPIIVTMVAVAAGLACLSIKGHLATGDARRRLRLIRVGTTVALTPAFLLIITAMVKHTSAEQFAPPWLWVTALLLWTLFPVTLAYVIVVHRAMDVRVVIHQGLRYALAKNGVRVLQVAMTLAVVLTVAALAAEPNRNRPQKIQVIAIGIAAVFLMQRGAERLRAWTDRRFFRDAYNAEQILNELSETVRSMVETGPLLKVVSQRVSESLHVPHVAVLLDSGGSFRPAYALGYSSSPDVAFALQAPTVRQLAAERQPATIYLDDPDSWINRDGVSLEERAGLERLRTEILLPLAAGNTLLGFISLSQKRSEEPYTGSDLRLLQSVAVQTGLALQNARLTAEIAEETARREKINRELEIAREVQERLFPQQLAPVPGLDYCGKCRPALTVGGDYYDFLVLPGGKLGIAIGDVSGKGISAALMMASLQASLRGQALVGSEDLAKVVANVNRLMYEASAANRYATFFYAQYEAATHTLTYVNAGHNPPTVLRSQNGNVQCLALEIGGAVVGLLPDFPYQQGSITLLPGDVFVAYTDGVTESMNPRDEEWGEERMLETIKMCVKLRAEEIIQRVMCAAEMFAAGAPQHDDMTLVIARVA